MKKLSELTPEEITALLKSNKFFREQAQEYAKESASIVVSDVLRPFQDIRGIDYNIGYPATYFCVEQNYYREFLAACIDHDYCGIFTEETHRRILRAENKSRFFEECLYGYIDISDEKFSHLEKWIDGIVEEAAREIAFFCEAEQDAAYIDEVIEENAFCFCDCNDNYETDGKYIYETTRRQYA